MFDSSKTLFMRALRQQPVERTPLWLMRQAGRYLPEYRQTRLQAGSFLNLCKNPELACEVTLQPLKRFQLDAAILFSDILTIPDAMNLGLNFAEGEGPYFSRPLHSFKAIESLSLPEKGSLDYVMQAIKLIRATIPADIPLIGFAGSPWTLACYMIEGKSSKEFPRIFSLLKEEPKVLLELLEKLTLALTEYLIDQAKAGADVLMIFDTWGGLLGSRDFYLKYSLNYMQTIIHALKKSYPEIPIILFTKGGGSWLSSIAESGCDVIGLDWLKDLGEARALVGRKVALQGNLNPEILLKDAAIIREEVQKILTSYGKGSGHIFNLGHGLTPNIPINSVATLVEAVREFSPFYHDFD